MSAGCWPTNGGDFRETRFGMSLKAQRFRSYAQTWSGLPVFRDGFYVHAILALWCRSPISKGPRPNLDHGRTVNEMERDTPANVERRCKIARVG